jgi:uncharacterized protein DUF7002
MQRRPGDSRGETLAHRETGRAPDKGSPHRDWPLPAQAFHIADAENWPSIRRSGLFSASRLIARDRLEGDAALPFAGHRATGMRLPSGVLIRDQSPMPPEALRRCLDPGLTPQDWYDLVNSKVYFWLDRDRLERHLAACGARAQILVAVDLPALVERHGQAAFLTPFNVGNARRRPASRGRRSFVPMAAWLTDRWRSEAEPGRPPRSASHPPAEIAIEDSVPDVMDFVLDARPLPARRG